MDIIFSVFSFRKILGKHFKYDKLQSKKKWS